MINETIKIITLDQKVRKILKEFEKNKQREGFFKFLNNKREN